MRRVFYLRSAHTIARERITKVSALACCKTTSLLPFSPFFLVYPIALLIYKFRDPLGFKLRAKPVRLFILLFLDIPGQIYMNLIFLPNFSRSSKIFDF